MSEIASSDQIFYMNESIKLNGSGQMQMKGHPSLEYAKLLTYRQDKN